MKNNLKYILIGLGPYSFQFDQSRGSNEIFRLLQYVIAFNDLHNFWLPVEEYRKIFRVEYLSYKFPYDSQMTCVRPLPARVNLMTPDIRIGARERIEIWKDRRFPETKIEYTKILDDYLTLCEKNNIRPIMFLPPVTEGYMKYFDKQLLDEFYCSVHDAQKKHPAAIFLDGWKLPTFPDSDFWDTDHLNINGAAKFSAMFNSMIENFERMS
ncbi:MAG: hypothetical protein IJT06_05585 [Selenomonadaceae bacterium]|nr:hypothetical protein [Selenomonadaceae bacterium]